MKQFASNVVARFGLSIDGTHVSVVSGGAKPRLIVPNTHDKWWFNNQLYPADLKAGDNLEAAFKVAKDKIFGTSMSKPFYPSI